MEPGAERLGEVLGAVRPEGGRRAVVVVGSGLYRGAGLPEAEPLANWAVLLDRLHAALGGTGAVPAAARMTDRFEWILRARAEATGAKVSDVEDGACAAVARLVRAATPRGPAPARVRALVDAGFLDLVTLNYDDLLCRAGRAVAEVLPRAAPAGRSPRKRKDARDLARRLGFHWKVEGANGPARVWHPHGTARWAGTVLLGTHRYGMAIAPAFAAFDRLKRAERRAVAAGGPAALAALQARRELHGSASWVELFAAPRPLVFLGCGLAPEETLLWWALHLRARNFARRPALRPPTLVLTLGAAGPPPHLQHAPAGVEVCAFPTAEALWSAWDAALAAPLRPAPA